MEASFSRALRDSLDEADILLFRGASRHRWLALALLAWLSVIGSLVINLPVDAISGGRLSDWLRGEIAVRPRWWIGAACLLLLVAMLLAWLRARGFMAFLDCLVHREGGPWAAWCRQGRSGGRLFLVWVVMAGSAAAMGGALVFAWLSWFRWRELEWGTLSASDGLFLGCICAAGALAAIVLGILGFLVEDILCAFLLRDTASSLWDQIAAARRLFTRRMDEILPYLGVRLCLAISAVSLVLTIGVFTCGLVFLPYLGTVLLLPVHAVWRLYPLFFLRQIGFDVWADGLPPLMMGQDSGIGHPPEPGPPRLVPPRLEQSGRGESEIPPLLVRDRPLAD